jgi:hypothetical protein
MYVCDVGTYRGTHVHIRHSHDVLVSRYITQMAAVFEIITTAG